MFLFSKSIIPEDSESSRRDLSTAGVKTRFKAIPKIVFLQKSGLLPPEGKTKPITLYICQQRYPKHKQNKNNYKKQINKKIK